MENNELEFFINITVNKVRNLASTVRRQEFSSFQAKAFLLLYGEALREHLDASLKSFVKDKVGI